MATRAVYKLVFILLVAGLFSCSPVKPIIHISTIEVDTTLIPQPIKDSAIVLIEKDSLLIGTIKDEKGDSIGYVKANPSTRSAEVFVQPKPIEFHHYFNSVDTIFVEDKDAPINGLFSLLNWWETTLIFFIISLLLFWKSKRKISVL